VHGDMKLFRTTATYISGVVSAFSAIASKFYTPLPPMATLANIQINLDIWVSKQDLTVESIQNKKYNYIGVSLHFPISSLIPFNLLRLNMIVCRSRESFALVIESAGLLVASIHLTSVISLVS
jgi:hypothetical protein